MTIACVVLDLDGTLTDLSRGDSAFSAAFTRHLADLLGKDLSLAFADEEARVRELAPELAWTYEGLAVGPADADPYVLGTSAAQRICDRFQILSDPGLRGEVLSALFRRAYMEATATFRAETRQVLEALLARDLSVNIITNASTQVATKKLAALAPAGLSRLQVRGDAAKFHVGAPARPDARFTEVPAERRVPGLARPVLPRRGRYFDALAAIWAETGVGPERTLVCGDIFELDLALPAELGAHVHLVRRKRTHPYEIDAVKALGPRGGISEGLAPLLERLP